MCDNCLYRRAKPPAAKMIGHIKVRYLRLRRGRDPESGRWVAVYTVRVKGEGRSRQSEAILRGVVADQKMAVAESPADDQTAPIIVLEPSLPY